MFDENVKLSAFSNFKIGGPARYFFLGDRIDNLTAAVAKAQKAKLPIFVLGGGTNLLISDEGFPGLVIKPELRFIFQQENSVAVGAGAAMVDLLDFCRQRSLAGLEWAGGLPGTVGGAIICNAGAFRGEIKDSLQEVISLDMSHNPSQIIRRNNNQCQFAYRNSLFKHGSAAGKEIVLAGIFALQPGDKKAIAEAIEEKIAWRKARQPLDYPNVGSIFKNVDWQKIPKKLQQQEEFQSHLKTDPFPVLPAATLIDKAGLKGVAFGGAMISPKHPNFIVNTLGATAGDVKQLIKLVKAAVRQRFYVELEEEVIFV